MIRTFTIEEGQKLTQEELELLRAAAKRPIVYDEDSPELTDEMEQAFIAARKAKPFREKTEKQGGD